MVTMVTKDDEGEGAHPLDNLGAEAAALPKLGDGTTELDVSARADQEAADKAGAEAMAAMLKGVQAVMLGGLRAVRTRLARNLPELLDEWSDEKLAGPAAAAVPVLNKYAARFMPLLGAYPEEAMLAMSLLPLVLGYTAAIDKHQAIVKAAAAPAAIQ
ncbi:MAG: hypothetical protein JWQ72_2652 [Polaromonas sp.]|nr:hypothetical protein [Polaromonas sp.]